MPTGIGGELAWYCPSLADSANDLSGNALHGTYQGGMGTVADTGSGGTRAYSMDGVNDYITVGSSSLFNLTGNFSIAAWIKPASASNYFFIVGNKTASWTHADGWLTYWHQGIFTGGFCDVIGASSSVFRTNPLNITTGNWKHVAITGTREATTAIAIYLDGVYFSGAAVNNVSLTSPGNAMWIGRRDAANVGYAQGSLDDLRLFNRVLTGAELLKLASRRAYQPFRRRHQSQSSIGVGTI